MYARILCSVVFALLLVFQPIVLARDDDERPALRRWIQADGAENGTTGSGLISGSLSAVEVQPQEQNSSSKVVTVEVWTSPKYDWNATTGQIDGPNVQLCDRLREVVVGFDDDNVVSFEPHMYIVSGVNLCTPDQKEACDASCTNGNRYCGVPPNNSAIPGKVIVEESLRRMCIWEVYGKNENSEDDVYYFDYMTALRDKQCGFADDQDTCIEDVYQSVGINASLVEACVQNSGGLEADAENQILQGLVNAQEQTGVNDFDTLPAILIDGEKINLDGLTLDSLFKTICLKLPQNKKPDICQDDVEENLGENVINVEVWTSPQYDWGAVTAEGNSNGPNMELYDRLREVVLGFDNDDALTVHPLMFVFSGENVCSSEDGSSNSVTPTAQQEVCDASCTNFHRYCGPPQVLRNDAGSSVTGKQLVEESLRRMCIWEVYNTNDDGQDDVFYFDYIKGLREKQCDTAGYQPSCVAEVYSSVGIDSDAVDGCIQKSGGLQSDAENLVLQELLSAEKANGISNLDGLPALFINGEKLQLEGLTLDGLFEAICKKYPADKQPDVCQGDVEETLGEDEDPYSEEGPVDPVAETAAPAESSAPKDSGSISGTSSPQSANSDTEGKLPTFGFNPALINKALNHFDNLAKCEVNTGALIQKIAQLGSDKNDVRQEVIDVEHDIPMLMSETCPEEQSSEILQRLDEFHMCSLFDLRKLIEDAPSILTGVMMRCARGYSNMTKEEEENGYIPEQCIRAIEADSLLGRGIFGMVLYPDKLCPCFEKLHDVIPECTADVWPIPINGALVKVESCLVGQYCQSIDGACTENLQILDDCLPATGTVPKTMDCDSIFQQCSAIYDVLPPMLSAIPMPDACVRVAEGAQFYGKHVIGRYDVFRHKCGKNMEIWEGHTPLAQVKAFVTDGVQGIDVSSAPFIGGTLGGFLAGIIFVGIVVCVRRVCSWCRRFWARCCPCCRTQSRRPKKSSYATVDTSPDEFMDEYTYRD